MENIAHDNFTYLVYDPCSGVHGTYTTLEEALMEGINACVNMGHVRVYKMVRFIWERQG